ncbi:hypothetical protein RISK_002877 [Rhodopirellula islandica]|uniref:Uncharacterized protein n=1 Tax=Rhodopirellula islandica TaxID=595434 RepID=A0A0J1BF12_RHOIS|nr:hypothetical protein RISK_002877 [Rhodopirellula islandica]
MFACLSVVVEHRDANGLAVTRVRRGLALEGCPTEPLGTTVLLW